MIALLINTYKTWIYLLARLHIVLVSTQLRLGGWERLLQIASSASLETLVQDNMVTGRQKLKKTENIV
jgi:hypothetical protein